MTTGNKHNILFLHGFTSSGECEIARMLKAELVGVSEVVAPALPASRLFSSVRFSE